MIYDLLKNRDLYDGVHPGVAKGLRFLAETDLSSLPDGRYEIDGARVFANIMTYETKQANPTPEAHREYIDIQYPFEGEELIGVAPLKEMTDVAEARPEGDIWLYHGPVEYVTIGRGRFIAVWPEDAHAPGVAPGGQPAAARKCVIKVHVK